VDAGSRACVVVTRPRPRERAWSAGAAEEAGQDLVDGSGQDDVGEHLNQVGREAALGGDRREGSLDQPEGVTRSTRSMVI